MNGVTPTLFGAMGNLPGNSSVDALAALFLISLVVGILGVAFLFVFLVRRSLKFRDPESPRSRYLHDPRRGFHNPMFDSSCRWLAIRGTSLGTVQEALHLHNVRPCNWADGLASAQDHKLFICPPVKGWILVMGSDLPEPADDVDACFHFLTKLSRSLGEVQYFSMNRILNHHAWVRLSDGRVVRGYAWAGETLWNEGRPTTSEIELDMKCFSYFESAQPDVWQQSDCERPNADKVLSLAGRWSLDPSTLEELVSREGPGIAGGFEI